MRKRERERENRKQERKKEEEEEEAGAYLDCTVYEVKLVKMLQRRRHSFCYN
jgi:hypothetical protein